MVLRKVLIFRIAVCLPNKRNLLYRRIYKIKLAHKIYSSFCQLRTVHLCSALIRDPVAKHKMAAKYIIGSIAASFAIAYVADKLVADEKIFGGTTPHTVSNKEWWEETDKKFQAWPRTAGPPVVMNPISRQNFIVKSGSES
ncbi:hypothetical protein V6N13_059612 [Hibiscus sabdariffa]|uniref:Uncharacterized protein n=1 Tax=Hibiscus sabdariffa TaxID=183260 RepID=A0ABR2GDQ4_9ROSI